MKKLLRAIKDSFKVLLESGKGGYVIIFAFFLLSAGQYVFTPLLGVNSTIAIQHIMAGSFNIYSIMAAVSGILGLIMFVYGYFYIIPVVKKVVGVNTKMNPEPKKGLLLLVGEVIVFTIISIAMAITIYITFILMMGEDKAEIAVSEDSGAFISIIAIAVSMLFSYVLPYFLGKAILSENPFKAVLSLFGTEIERPFSVKYFIAMLKLLLSYIVLIIGSALILAAIFFVQTSLGMMAEKSSTMFWIYAGFVVFSALINAFFSAVYFVYNHAAAVIVYQETNN